MSPAKLMSLLKRCLSGKKSDQKSKQEDYRKTYPQCSMSETGPKCSCSSWSEDKWGGDPKQCAPRCGCPSQVRTPPNCACCQYLRTPEGLQSLLKSVPQHNRSRKVKALPARGAYSKSITVSASDPPIMGPLPGYPPQVPLSKDGEERFVSYQQSLQLNQKQAKPEHLFVPPPNRTVGDAPRLPHHASKYQTSQKQTDRFNSTGSSQSRSSPSPQGAGYFMDDQDVFCKSDY